MAVMAADRGKDKQKNRAIQLHQQSTCFPH